MKPPDEATLNAEQIEYWNKIAGTRWTEGQAALDRALEPFLRVLMERAALKQGERVLDVGCGCGATTLAFADAVGPSGRVVGVDVSRPMLDRAGERGTGRGEVQLLLADASLHRFEAPFDLIASRFGVMFFRDPVLAFANLRRALRPGGRMVFVCWRPPADNPWMTAPSRAIASVLAQPPAPVSPEDPGPFAFADAARVERILVAAGFSDVAIDRWDAEVQVAGEGGTDEAVHFAATVGPGSRLLQDLDDTTRARALTAVRALLAPLVKPSGLWMAGSVWIVRAGVPG